jgi:hypothetical protein
MNYKPVKNLLAKGETSSKMRKNEKLNYASWIMYLAPYTQNSKGINLCPNASAGCAAACLFTAGRGRFSSVENARKNKTEYFLHDRQLFLAQLWKELQKIEKKAGNKCVRLNGTSDIDFPKLFLSHGFGDLCAAFPSIQFYDYTKSLYRVQKYAGSPYHLTFSRSETNDLEVSAALQMGANVAIVFDELPTTYKGVQVVNGDESDLRFLDPSGCIVGLKAKGKAKKGANPFVISNTKIKLLSKLPKCTAAIEAKN